MGTARDLYNSYREDERLAPDTKTAQIAQERQAEVRDDFCPMCNGWGKISTVAPYGSEEILTCPQCGGCGFKSNNCL